MDGEGGRSIHSDNVPDVHEVPLRVIIRPIPPVLEESKVESLMRTVQMPKVSSSSAGGQRLKDYKTCPAKVAVAPADAVLDFPSRYSPSPWLIEEGSPHTVKSGPS